MIGRLTFPYRQALASATLADDGRWHCPEVPAVVRVLDTLYSPRRDGVDAATPHAHRYVHRAAQWLRGTVIDPAADRH